MSDDLLTEFANFTTSSSEDSDSEPDCSTQKPLSRSAKLTFSEPLFLAQVHQWGSPPCELSLYTHRHTILTPILPARWPPHIHPSDSASPEEVAKYASKERAELAQAKAFIESVGGAGRAKAFAEELYYGRRWEEARVVAEMVLRVDAREGFARGEGFGDTERRDLGVLCERVGRKVGGVR